MINPLFETAGLTVFERGWLSSNNVLFDAGPARQTTLVDTGYVSHSAQTLALVRRALGSRPLDCIVNTHLHSDHCGGNFALQEAYGCGIAVPAGEVGKVERWDEAALTYRATGQRCPRFSSSYSIRAGDELALGPRIWNVIAAPGHDPEAIVLYQPELRILISADALWENGFGVVFPELEGVAAFDQVSATLDRIEALEPRWVIPGHGAPFDDVGGAIDRARRRLAGLVAHPTRHARHAAKVLIKFRLLETQRERLADLRAWLDATPYLRLTHRHHFSDMEFAVWSTELLEQLAASGSVSINGDWIANE